MSESETHIRNFNLSNIVIIPFMTVLGIVGFFLKREKLIQIPSVIIFAFIVPCYVIIGLELSNFFLRTDLCSDIRKYTTSDFKPILGKGLGYYISCISKESLVDISTARYELSLSYNKVYDDINNKLEKSESKERLPEDKRSIEELKKFSNGKSQDFINGIAVLIDYNNVFEILNNETQCVYTKNIVYNVESNLCYLNLENNFDMLKYYFWAVFFYILLSVGLNRLIVLVNPNLDRNNAELIKANNLLGSKTTFFNPN